MNGLADTVLGAGVERLWQAAGVAAAFVAVCVASALSGRPKTQEGAAVLVLFASQTGQAEEIAKNAHARLVAGGLAARVAALGTVTPEQLRVAERILCVVSTTGDGEAPDNGARFEAVMDGTLDLAGKSFAVLALGDRNYERFCGFGRRVFDWFRRCGAVALTPCLEADDLDAAVLAQWQAGLTQWGAGAVAASAAFPKWKLVERKRLNPRGSGAIWRIGFVPDGDRLMWRAGDLAEIETLDGHRRDYSIASLPSEGQLNLLVREVRTADGAYGKGSGLLIRGLEPGGTIGLRVKTHDGFHAAEGKGPVLLVGAGSGLAGLRPHILEALAAGRSVRVVYGERHPVNDAGLCEELVRWRDEGRIALDLAFSRPDDGQGRYVQAVVGADVAAWLGDDGAVMVCGGLDMGKGVEAALRSVCGGAWVDQAFADGRYRRDLY
ncbi:NADPH cytochrome P450 oxidoreductase family protein [Asticcacaulis solisilvae]|uniref:NADPH cytochrome P450 oxidoreductase family protein n=1 Tax=Asticcacaulis solisilvae TaxID=1217274 RepID=UPI003FD7372A